MLANSMLSILAAQLAASRITLSPKTMGSFDILVDNVNWFPAGQPTSVRHAGKTLSAGDGSLKHVSDSQVSGHDGLGTFSLSTWSWGSASDDDFSWTTWAKVYDDAVVFGQTFASGADDTSTGDRDKLISSFPSFQVSNYSSGRRGYLQYSGDMVGSGYHTGEWDDKSSGVGSGITGTAPLCVFSEDLKASVVLSPFSNFMAASQLFDDKARSLSYGVMGGVTSVPAGYSVSFVLSLSGAGINAAMLRWGDLLLNTYGKSREGAWQRDVTLQKLGYSTDNGAFCAPRPTTEHAPPPARAPTRWRPLTRSPRAAQTTTRPRRAPTTRRPCWTSRRTPRLRASPSSTWEASNPSTAAAAAAATARAERLPRVAGTGSQTRGGASSERLDLAAPGPARAAC